MLNRKKLLVFSCSNRIGSSYLSFKQLILLSVLGHYYIAGCLQHLTIYCSPVTPSSNHTKHLRHFNENEVHLSNTLAKPQIPSAKNYSTPSNFSIKSSNGTIHRLLTYSEHQNKQQPIKNNSYVTIEINGTESFENTANRNQTFDDSQEPLTSSESKPSVVVSHIMVDEDDPLPPMSILMSDTSNGTHRAPFEFTDGELSIRGTESRPADVKNFMKLMQNSTSQWLGRSQALSVTTSRRPILSPKSRKFLQNIKSKRKSSSLASSIINTSAKSTLTPSPTQSPSVNVPGPIQSSLTESASSKHENWVDHDNRVEHEASSGQFNDDGREPLEESASTNSGRRAPLRLSIKEQQRFQTSNTPEEESEGKPVVSESTTTTIEDDRGKKSVFRHGPGSSFNGGTGDNKLPAKLREKIIEQFLKNGGDPQNIVVSDSTITTTSQSKKKTITTVYKIVPIEGPVPARGLKSNSLGKLPVQSDHDDDEHQGGYHTRPPQPQRGINLSEFIKPESPVFIKGKYQKYDRGGGKKLKKVMVTRIEVPQKELEFEPAIKTGDLDDSLGEFYSGPHETIFEHMNQDKAKDSLEEQHDSDLGSQPGWPKEEEHDVSTYKLNEMTRNINDNSHNRARTHKDTKNHDSQLVDESFDKGADEYPIDSTANDNGIHLEAGKKAQRKTLRVMALKKSPSSLDSANVSRDTEDRRSLSNEGSSTREDQSTQGDAVKGEDAISNQEPPSRKPVLGSQNKGKPKSGRAKAPRGDLTPPLLPKHEDKPVDVDAVIAPVDQNSAQLDTTRQPTATSSRHPGGHSGPSESRQRSPGSIGITTERPNNRKSEDNAEEQRDIPSASVALARNNSGQKRDSGGPSRNLSGRRGQVAATSTTSTTTSTTTTTTTTSTTTTPKPKARITTRAAGTRRPTQVSLMTSRAPTTTTDAPESLVEDNQPVVTSQDYEQQSGTTSPPERQSNSGGAKAQLGSISRTQPTMVPIANATVASTSEPTNGALQQQRAQQQQPIGKTRNIMMLIDFDAPPATSNENFSGVVQKTFEQRLPAGDSNVARRFKSESQQFETPLLSSLTTDGDNQWRPLSYPHQWHPQQVSTSTMDSNKSNSRQQAPTVSVQIYNNLARDQQRQQQETPLEQSTISPSDADFFHQMALIAQPSNPRQQHPHPSPPTQFTLEPSISSGTNNGDPFEDFAAATPRTRDVNGRQFQLSVVGGNSSLLGARQYYQPPQRDAMPFLFASSSQIGRQNHAVHSESVSGMQQVSSHAHLQPKQQQHGELAVLPDESAQTNRMLMRVIDEIAKSALASGYQVADNQRQQTTSSVALNNYLTSSGGVVSAPSESHDDVDQVGESDSDGDGEVDDNDTTGNTQYPLNSALMAGNHFPSSSQPAAISLTDLLMMNHAISDSQHQATTRTTPNHGK